ncbi:hypothetical protein [uncultured Sphingomonas sp.]|uniref:hypothetical protein n=1 Tax=uncultured Sphingomonas sp. TaxID=158754 RepID=UPI0035CA94ED
MADEGRAGQLGDLVGSTRDRLQATGSPADRLKGLVPERVAPRTEAEVTVAPAAAMPSNYFPQVTEGGAVAPKRRPQRGPTRSIHISMRLAPAERDRFVRWCEDRNLSLADGLGELLDAAEGSKASRRG